MVLTHGHPDHYAGAATLLDGLDVPIVATAAVDAVIRRDDALKETIVGPMMGAEWPSTRRFPDRVVESGSTVDLGGVTFGVVDLGPGESDADSLWTIGDRIVFAGDLVYDAMDAYLADGRYAEWLAVLDRLDRELAPEAVLFPGHGRPRGRDALEAQRRYVRAFVDAVGDALALAPEDRRARVVAALAGLVRDDRLRFLVELSIEPVAGLLRDRTTETQRGRGAAPAATGGAGETSA